MLTGYERSSFAAATSGGVTVNHDVCRKGEGPVVVLIQELPGIGEATLALASASSGCASPGTLRSR